MNKKGLTDLFVISRFECILLQSEKPIKLRALQVQLLIYFVHKFYVLVEIIYFFQSMFMKKPLIFFHDIEKQNKTICFTFVTNNTIYQQTIIYYVVKSNLCSEIYPPTYLKCIFSSNQIVPKISFSLCFWAPDPLIDIF